MVGRYGERITLRERELPLFLLCPKRELAGPIDIATFVSIIGPG
jgi:hypothetical protein